MLLLLLLAGITGYLMYLNSDEAQIRRSFAGLCGAVDKSSGSGFPASVASVKSLEKFLAEEVTIDADEKIDSGIFSRTQLVSRIFYAREYFQYFTVTFHDMDISADGRTARVYAAAMLSGALNNGSRIREVREIAAELVKVNRQWLFSSFEIRKVLEK